MSCSESQRRQGFRGKGDIEIANFGHRVLLLLGVLWQLATIPPQYPLGFIAKTPHFLSRLARARPPSPQRQHCCHSRIRLYRTQCRHLWHPRHASVERTSLAPIFCLGPFETTAPLVSLFPTVPLSLHLSPSHLRSSPFPFFRCQWVVCVFGRST